MDLNMIKGLGPTFRQSLYKNGIFNVEQLVKTLPSKIEFYDTISFDSIAENSNVTLEVTVLTYVEAVSDKENHNFSVNCDGNVILANIQYHYSLKKYLIPGKK